MNRSGKLKRTEETDKNGKFSFADLADGDYDVTVTLEKDWVAVKDFTAYKDLQVEGATLSDVDFALHGNNLDNAVGAVYSGEAAIKLNFTLAVHKPRQRLVELALKGGNLLLDSANPTFDVALYLVA